ncbi:hypothetical protein ACSQ67_016451 [Phaseolus vulgaris]
MKDAATEFFSLPIEEKNKYAMPSNEIHGYGKAYSVSEEKTLDWELIEGYTSEVRRVSKEILSSLSVIMGMQKHVFLGLHKESLQSFRVNYYPPYSTPRRMGASDSNIRCSSCKCGDVIEILTNGKYKSIEHRAVTNKNKKRLSYALFVCPNGDAEVEPLDHVIDAQNPRCTRK